MNQEEGAPKRKNSLSLSHLSLTRSLTLSPLSSVCNFVSLFCFFYRREGQSAAAGTSSFTIIPALSRSLSSAALPCIFSPAPAPPPPFSPLLGTAASAHRAARASGVGGIGGGGGGGGAGAEAGGLLCWRFGGENEAPPPPPPPSLPRSPPPPPPCPSPLASSAACSQHARSAAPQTA